MGRALLVIFWFVNGSFVGTILLPMAHLLALVAWSFMVGSGRRVSLMADEIAVSDSLIITLVIDELSFIFYIAVFLLIAEVFDFYLRLPRHDSRRSS